MQVLRGIVIVIGILVALAGLYILFLGLGAPIEIDSFELGIFKASGKGIGVGLLVAAVGLAITGLAMTSMKRTVTRERVTESVGKDGIIRRWIEKTTIKQFWK